MREIKFRAWDKENKKMIYPVYGVDEGVLDEPYLTLGGQVSHHDLSADEDVSDIYELMQFTGLKDKNRKEIWEGDIVGKFEDKDNLDYDDNPSKWIQVIEWNDEKAGWDILDTEVITVIEKIYSDQWDGNCGLDNPEELEVIGNIYENPELLK